MVRSPGRTLIEGLRQQLGTPDRELLLQPWRHHPLLEGQRARLIISRVRLVALLFAVLTPLWILVDLVFLPWPVWGELALARLLTSTAFLAMAVRYPSAESMPRAWVALALLFAIPTLFFLYSHPLLALRDMAGIEAAIAAGYAFLPFVMIAGLAIFPLTATEALAYAIPVLAGQAIAAFLQLDGMDWTTHAGAFWLLLLIASVATLASMSQLQFLAALVRESSRDPLTGCYTRRSGQRLLEREVERARRQAHPLSVAFVDLDRFKVLNDRFGHEEGDRALQAMARSLTSGLRGIDSVIRWGGEEFLILMPDTTPAGARDALERVLATPIYHAPDGRPLTASTGIAGWPDDARATDIEALVHEADLRMYRAKDKGGDRIINGRVAAWVSLEGGMNPSQNRLDQLVAEAQRSQAERERGYREQALKMYPWVCGRCGREFTRANLRELTVHHRDHNHDNNPADGSNWELLCLYCHDNEHQRYTDATPGNGRSAGTTATHNPFAGLAGMLKGDPGADDDSGT